MARGDLQLWKFEGADKRAFYASLVDLDASFSDGTTGWAHIGTTGVWRGYEDGKTFELTVDIFNQMVANCERRASALNFDYEHQTCNPFLVGPVPSSGAILKLEVRGQELWALVDWTPTAAELIRTKQYRYCSMVIDFESRDRATNEVIGPEVKSVALTNDPFIDGLTPLKLKRYAMAGPNAQDPTKQVPCSDPPATGSAPAVAAADTPPAAATPADEPAGAPGAASLISSVAEATGLGEDQVLAALMDNIDALAKLVGGTTATDGMPSDQTAMSVQAAQLRHQTATITALKAQLTKLQATIDGGIAAEKARQEAAAKLATETRVKQLQADGYVALGEQAFKDAVFLFSTHPDVAARQYAAKIIPTGGTQSGASDYGTGDPVTDERIEPATVDGLNDSEKAMVIGLSNQFGDQDARKVVSLMRRGMKPVDAARKIRDARKAAAAK